MLNFVKSARYDSRDPHTQEEQAWEVLVYSTVGEIEDQLAHALIRLVPGFTALYNRLRSLRRDVVMIKAMGYLRLSYTVSDTTYSRAHRPILSGTPIHPTPGLEARRSPPTLALDASKTLSVVNRFLPTPVAAMQSPISERAVVVYYLCALAECHFRLRLGATSQGKAWSCVYSALNIALGLSIGGRKRTKELMWRAREALKKDKKLRKVFWDDNEGFDHGIFRGEWFNRVVVHGLLAKVLTEKLGEKGGVFRQAVLVETRVWTKSFEAIYGREMAHNR